MPGDFIGTFAKFFTGLTRSQRSELERVMSDAQNSKEITSLETSSKLLRRKVNQRLPIPQPVAKTTVRGAIIEWDALVDQRITFYEIDVADTNLFATFETFPTYGLQIVLDGLTATKFIRVRGIRRDGTTTPNSNTVIVTPEVFQLQTHNEEAFYQTIEGTSPNVILGGLGSDLDYIPINLDGESKVWGFITTYADPAIAMFGTPHIFADVVVKTKDSDGFTLEETIQWRVTMGEFFNSHAIGPFTVAHPDDPGDQLEIRLEVTDESTKINGSARSADSTTVFWAFISTFEVGI